jgi:hypothetical protein
MYPYIILQNGLNAEYKILRKEYFEQGKRLEAERIVRYGPVIPI